jgi:hypothetical protein
VSEHDWAKNLAAPLLFGFASMLVFLALIYWRPQAPLGPDVQPWHLNRRIA